MGSGRDGERRSIGNSGSGGGGFGSSSRSSGRAIYDARFDDDEKLPDESVQERTVSVIW